MPWNIKEISEVIERQIKNYGKEIIELEQGSVISVGDGIALIYGLANVMLGELLIFPNNVYGVALSLEEGAVGAVILGDTTLIKEGDVVICSNQRVETPVGNSLVGRVVNGLGAPIDDNGAIKTKKYRPVESVAFGVMARKSISEPLETGILAIDAAIPIGKGQRELIIGDRQTGKTSLAIDVILNQKGKNVKCIYVSIGQKDSTIAQIVENLKKHGAMEYTTIVNAGASASASLQYFAPYTGVSIAEEWMINGEDVLIVYDDLTKHASAYREMSLLLRRPPGREAYPGDIFYLHSRLLERAARISKENGGGSITALPIVETQAGDISAYVPTNIISITDGQIFLSADLFKSGIRPAVNIGTSVSRVGSTAQIKAIKQVSGTLKFDLAQYNELAAFSKFGSDLDPITKEKLDHGAKITKILIQRQYYPYSQTNQALILLAIKYKLIKWLPLDRMLEFKIRTFEHFAKEKEAKKIYKIIEKSKEISEEMDLLAKIELEKIIIKITKGIPNYVVEHYGNTSEFKKLGK